VAAAHAMEQAFESIPALRWPRPNLDALSRPVPELKSIVTHPPGSDPAVDKVINSGV